jgi:hypothetical protein
MAPAGCPSCSGTRVTLDGACVASALVGGHSVARVGWIPPAQNRAKASALRKASVLVNGLLSLERVPGVMGPPPSLRAVLSRPNLAGFFIACIKTTEERNRCVTVFRIPPPVYLIPCEGKPRQSFVRGSTSSGVLIGVLRYSSRGRYGNSYWIHLCTSWYVSRSSPRIWPSRRTRRKIFVSYKS